MPELLAFICFLAAAIWAFIDRRQWPLVLIAAGLALSAATGIHIHTS
jgi:predicted transcriptional regulator